MSVNQYRLVECDNNKFLIEKNNTTFWNVAFSSGWVARYGFEAIDSSQNKFILKSRNIFSKKLTMYKNDELFAYFKNERCVFPFERVWLDGRKFIYDEQKYICSLDLVRKKIENRETIYEWEIEGDLRYEWVVASIAMISIQNKAHITGIRY